MPEFDGFEAGVFTGKYVTGDETAYLNYAEKSRARNEQLKQVQAKLSNLKMLDLAELKAPSEINIYNSGDY